MSAALAGRIGPNAITRVAQVLPARIGTAAAHDLFEAAGLERFWRAPPEAMVDEADVRRLHGTLRRSLGAEVARDVSLAAGRATADYLLEHRIPKPLQRVLRRLPAGLAARVLLAAITRHAWTFTGSGRFSAGTPGPFAAAVTVEIRDNPLCRDLATDTPACHYYAAVFERLFGVLVHPATVVRETACEACGDEACRFEIRWRV